MVAQVLVELSSKSIDKLFDYNVPFELEKKVVKGVRVLVPFGSRELEGFVLSVSNSSGFSELKNIISVVGEDTSLSEELLELGNYLHETTLASLIKCYQVMLPKALKVRNGFSVSKKYIKMISLGSINYSYDSLTSKQRDVMDVVLSKGSIKRSELELISKGALQTLLTKTILKEDLVEVYRLQDSSLEGSIYPLTPDQQRVVDSVVSNKGHCVNLLHGVTGSGKTEVYMEIIASVISEGKTAIVLVPEISLTPQIVKRFRSRFSTSVAILHSRLSEGEKYDEYRKISRGEVSIVIGARSAIFAPFTNLGVIIIDEEHSTSYHQESMPRYSAVDVAIYRGKKHDCPVILGSATPTLESFARTKRGVYKLLELPKRVLDRPLPEVFVVDMCQSKKTDNFYFSEMLFTKIKDRIVLGEQVLLLLNRRGYASYITCSNCGHTEGCPHCDISLTYHKTSGMLRCHYCGYAHKLPSVCPECGEESIKNLGVGTERIQEELLSLLPDVRVLRMDFDTTSQKGSHERMITSFSNLEYDILLGTQMIAKGLDFPQVTLVGVINADTSLNIPDFRSSEATFQLIDQVAGRSGRGTKKGEVVIQTFNPDHYAIMYAKNHDYQGFYESEMKLRQQLKYSPYFYMSLIKISSKDYDLASKESSLIASKLKKDLKNTIVLGPSISSLFKINQVYYFQIILKYKKEDNLLIVLKQILDHYKTNMKINIQIDFSPTSFL